ncbi:MAG: N-acyl-D-amino-acid deacylase family protein [Candidatus Binatia bacterium]
MADFDVIIAGGTLIDGTRVPRYRADLGIKNGRVAEIGRLQGHQAKKVLAAGGMIVAPGFIDLHTHYDAQVFWDPYCTISGWHGITSAVIGNCGFGFAPVRPEERERSMLTMTRVEAIPYAAMKEGMPWDWVTFPEFLSSIERTPKGINLLPYVPVAPIMIWVMGLDEAKSGRRPTPAEEKEMCRLLHEGMDAGGCGWSAQRLGPDSVQRDYDGTPMVTDIMYNETAAAFARVLGERNEGFMQMTYISATGDVAEVESHFEELAEISGRPILFNVVQGSKHFPERHRNVLAWLDRCRAKGQRIYGQGVTTDPGFTFTFEDWNMWDNVPAWREATLGTLEERRVKLADPNRRAGLKNDPSGQVTGAFDEIFIFSVKRPDLKSFENLTLREAGAREGKHPVDVLLDLAVADNLKTEFYTTLGCELSQLTEVVRADTTLLGVSDGGAHTKFFTAGRYPTETLAQLVREHNVMSLEEAHWKLSALPAFCAGFKDRGMLREGAPADIVVYDYNNLKVLPMEIAHDLPGGEWRRVQRAEGYRYVLVNGEVTIENDQPTGVTSGKLLRHGQA